MRAGWLFLLLLPGLAAAQGEDLEVLHRVDLLPSGDALWTFERRYPLESPLDERAWNSTVAGLNRTHPDFLRLAEGLRLSVEAGARAAGRPMEARNFTPGVRRESFGTAAFGVVAVRFEWRGLVGPEGGFGDALPDGVPLGPRDGLVLRYPADLSPAYVYPAADRSREGELVWLGPRNLGAGEPFVRLQPSGGAPGLLPGLALGAAAAAGALLAARRLRRRAPPRPGFEVDEGVALKMPEGAGEVPRGSIVEGTGWSKARVGKVPTALAKKGPVEEGRRGRENVVRPRRRS
ncbi:MAG: hypothetical protein QXT68_08030 [Halobacteria archaeon]